MAYLTPTQKIELKEKYKSFVKNYMKNEFLHLDESGTRIMVNYFLSQVLGFLELVEIKTEYAIKSLYADYVIQVENKRHFVVEVKSIDLELNQSHLRQAEMYAANEGIEWIMLTNGRALNLYRVIFDKPISTHKIFEIDFLTKNDIEENVDKLSYLTKKCVISGELDNYWKRFMSLNPSNMLNYLSEDCVLNEIRKLIKKDVGINFELEEIKKSITKLKVK